MALSNKAKIRLENMLGGAARNGDKEAQEIIAALEAGGEFEQSAAVADEATADATDEASAVLLANALKAKVNEILASLRASGQMAS